MNTLKSFISYYKPYKKMFFMDMFCALTLSAIDLAFPIIVKNLLDNVGSLESHVIVKYVLVLGAFMLSMYVARFFCQYYIASSGHIMGARMEADMRKDIFGHLQKLSFSYYDENNTGKLMSRVVTDLFDISELAHHGPEDVFISILKIVGSFILLLNINVKMTLILMVITFTMMYCSYFYNKRMRAIFKKNREKIANLNAQIQDSLSGVRVVKSFANEHVENVKFCEGNRHFLDTKERGYRLMGKFFSMNGFFQGLLYLSVVLSGGIFISKGIVTTADLVVYILYINIFLQPIEKLVNFTEQYQKGLSGFDRFLEVMNTNPDVKDKKDAKELKNPNGDIVFKDVSFGYDNENTILEGINMVIEAGKTVAIVGPSGSGKTTFCNIIPRFYEINKGEVTISDENIQNLKLVSLRQNIGTVQQDVYIFGGTIKDNIAYGDVSATDEQIIKAAKQANAHEFIMGLENGYNTYVGERGIKLSGGQKQRISIARVFLKNPPILILDEATSALDNESEKYIQKSLDELSKNRTSIVIAHRLSTIKNADKIIVLTENGIEESGSHDQLLEKNGVYAKLYNMQFEEKN